jgi:hypothetical protein
LRALPSGGPGAISSTARAVVNFRSSQFQSVSSGSNLTSIPAGSGLRASTTLPTGWGGGNVPSSRLNSSNSAFHGTAPRSFSVSLSNIMSKPKFGFGVQ